MLRAEKSLTAKWQAFFARRADEVAEQISSALSLDEKRRAADLEQGALGRTFNFAPGDPNISLPLLKQPHLPNAVRGILRKVGDEEDDDQARAEALLAGLDLGDWAVMIDPTADELAAIWASGVKQALPLVGFANGDETINRARAAMDLDPVPDGDDTPDIVGLVNPRSVDWARSHAAELVTQIEDNTRDMLRATVTQGITEGWGAVKLGQEIRDSAGFSAYRAQLIGRTETIRANNQGNLAAYRESGVATGKEWATAGDDLVEEICQDNEDAGPISLDAAFPSGDDAPPAHPACRCSILPVVEPLGAAES